ncbi:carbohydrate sulfotransferase 1-like [Actinia tenebrosa]|uniref:Carbohydrate sulfotransferase 1-like n=1 Tax=Actinia tenebrosa TaxID=6105 RepID=A0A6P8IN07_ACTTE|nr:carbohydrate sulfotransferase 1-like [Actinia tenebrosa]
MGSKQRSIFRYNIVLMAYKRSGSSFVGQLFNHHPDILYLYEPIFFLKELERNHGNAYRILSRRLLNTIFTCNFEENPYFVSQLSDSAFRLSSRVLSKPPMCPSTTNMEHVQEECQRIHTSTLIDICQSYRHVVIKTIRVKNLDELKELRRFNIEAPWNIMKVIHLVRDPRAIINSRAHIDLSRHNTKWTKADYQTNARALCTQVLNNLKKGVSEEAFETMYHVIRYEDIATQTERATRELYEFANLPWSEKAGQWLRQNTLKTHEFHPFSTTKNATMSLNLWRTQLDVETIRTIEQECSIMMTLLGYNKVKNPEHLQDISRPLFRDNKSSTVYITKNITDVMLEIEYLKEHGLL